MSQPTSEALAVVAFWRDAGPSRWFTKDPGFDAAFRERFLALHERAASGDLDGWAETADGALALLILLDQLPRNAFRGSPRMYATDPQALRIAHAALARGLDDQVPPELRGFMVMPLMHSEDPADQALCVEKSAQLPHTLPHALEHQDIIRRFGRFPHRNAVLGRTSTAPEERFIAEGGFSG
ncbi:MAG: hypothetical protein JWP65_708 [Ramlibacter sp.]|jgi:uncharacterized protein (DUF924 family)|uniref:DUF924 family protein n=1 Tax=Ramlibacter sp. TaxID=1917967 RepID=UPI00262EAACF|nr:DUF924 family protein [Ramlibacter sp.]MDB5750287.1 hypothetical protein [Ramlibacter sp.]